MYFALFLHMLLKIEIIWKKNCLLSYRRVVIQRNSLSVDDNIYAPPWELSTLAKEFTAATRMMQSSLNELSTLVSGKAKM